MWWKSGEINNKTKIIFLNVHPVMEQGCSVPKDQGAWAHGIQYLFFLHINAHLGSGKDTSVMSIWYFKIENLCSLQFYHSTAKQSHTEKNPNSFSTSFPDVFLPKMVAQHNHPPSPASSPWFLPPVDALSPRHSSEFQLTCPAGGRMALSRARATRNPSPGES